MPSTSLAVIPKENLLLAFASLAVIPAENLLLPLPFLLSFPQGICC
jgi:hypothetical protein